MELKWSLVGYTFKHSPTSFYTSPFCLCIWAYGIRRVRGILTASVQAHLTSCGWEAASSRPARSPWRAWGHCKGWWFNIAQPRHWEATGERGLNKGCVHPHIISYTLRGLGTPPQNTPQTVGAGSGVLSVFKVSLCGGKHLWLDTWALTVQEKNIFPEQARAKSKCRTGSCRYRDDVHEVVLPQGVQYGCDGVFGNGHPQSLHAAAHVHQDDDVLGRSGGLYVPIAERKAMGRKPRLYCHPAGGLQFIYLVWPMGFPK